jgi:NADPH-dependent curcumin reductase CurA
LYQLHQEQLAPVYFEIAQIKGRHVVGNAGSEENVDWLLDEAKIDYAFNYKNMG